MAKTRTKLKGSSYEGSFNYDEFEKEAIDRLKEGADLVGSDGVLTGLIQRLVNAAQSGEMNAHLKQEQSRVSETGEIGIHRSNWTRS